MEVIKGRMYDYNNGRFLSVDPFIQNPTSTQSMNPYTYIFNNPLSGVDPSGYKSEIDKYGTKNVAPSGSHIKSGKRTTGKNSEGGTAHIEVHNGKVTSAGGFGTLEVTNKGGNSDIGKQSTVYTFGLGDHNSDADKERNVRTSAQNSAFVYSSSGGNPGNGFEVLDKARLDGMDLDINLFSSNSGFKAILLYDKYRNVLQVAFAGTENEIGDFQADYLQGTNDFSTQHNEAMILALEVSRAAHQANIPLSYTGHSLGGGLASLASITTGDPAITFNAAGLNVPYRAIAPFYPQANSLVQAYYIKGEVLSLIQDYHPEINKPAPPAVGARHALTPYSSSTSSLDLHRITNVCLALSTTCNY